MGWQRLTNPSRRASKAVIPYLGDYMKHAVKYTFSAHAFDDFAFPRNGEEDIGTSALSMCSQTNKASVHFRRVGSADFE